MLRQHLHPEPGFEWRAGEITRLEAFSDAVFAFAVTLLVVSLEVPHTFQELLDVIRGFPAFAICFAMLLLVWYNHAKFFRRYGLQGPLIQAVNGALLFVVLFYVYPLKFLFTILVGLATRGATLPHARPLHDPMAQSDVGTLMSIYGLGYASVFGLFALMYWLAYRRRDELQLNQVEIFRTRHSLADHCAMMSFGLISTAIALVLPANLAGLAGWVYMFIGPYYTVAGQVFGKRERMLRQRLEKGQSKETASA